MKAPPHPSAANPGTDPPGAAAPALVSPSGPALDMERAAAQVPPEPPELWRTHHEPQPEIDEVLAALSTGDRGSLLQNPRGPCLTVTSASSSATRHRTRHKRRGHGNGSINKRQPDLSVGEVRY